MSDDKDKEIERLEAKLKAQNKLVMYCIKNIWNTGKLKYIGTMCRKIEKM